MFYRVEYAPERQRELIRKVLEAYSDLIDPRRGHTRRSADFAGLAVELAVLRALLKQPAYSSEREYRLLLPAPPWQTTDRVRFRATAAAIIPYWPVRIGDNEGRLPIVEVIVGPCLENEQTRKSIEFLFQHHGYQEIAINRSRVEMRAT